MDPTGSVSDTTPATTTNPVDDRTTQEPHSSITSTATTDTTTTTTTATVTTTGNNNAEPASQPLDDEEKAITFYQNAEPYLRPVFDSILEFCDKVKQTALDYHAIYHILEKVCVRSGGQDSDIAKIAQYAAAAGFVPQAVKAIRRAIGTGVFFSSADKYKERCSELLLNLLLNYAYVENEVRLRLVNAGMFRDFVQCLETFRLIWSDTVLGRKKSMYILGILRNCCKNPEVATQLKDKDIDHQLVPFLDKREDIDIKLTAFFLLARIVDDTRLGFLEMDHEMLECSLNCVKIGSTMPDKTYKFPVPDSAVGLSYAARLEFNQRLIVAKEGAIEWFKTMLQNGQEEEEIRAVLGVFAQLATDPMNAKVFQRDRELVRVLTALRDTRRGRSADDATMLITKIQKAVPEEDDITEGTSLYEVLANRANYLIILDVGKVEFLLNRLTDLISGRSSGCEVTEVHIVKALRELAKQEESYRREILARGGLSLLLKLLQRDGDADRLESINLLLELASCKEYTILIEGDTGLMELVQRLTRHEDQQVYQAARQLVEVIRNQGQTIITSAPR